MKLLVTLMDPAAEDHVVLIMKGTYLMIKVDIYSSGRNKTSKTPYVAIDERGLVRNIHLFLFSCVH